MTNPLAEQVAAVERAAMGIAAPDVAAQTAALTAAAASLRELRQMRMSAGEALDRIKASNEEWLRSVRGEPANG